jgi:hypothetical protein
MLLRAVFVVQLVASCAAVEASGFICFAEPPTVREELADARRAVFVRRGGMREVETLSASAEGKAMPTRSTFAVIEVLKGLGEIRAGDDLSLSDALAQLAEEDSPTFVTTCGDDGEWLPPRAISPAECDYMRTLAQAKSGFDFSLFYYNHWRSHDERVAADAVRELTALDAAALQSLRPLIDRRAVWDEIEDREALSARRRLACKLLAIGGDASDAARLKEIVLEGRQFRHLDALLACYLRLTGAAGVRLIEDQYLTNGCASYGDIYSAILALRDVTTSGDDAARQRTVVALRLMLDRPELADLVMPDLARQRDWSQMQRIVQLFKEADPQHSWVRVPTFQYLAQCPLPAARKHLAELRELDREAYERSVKFAALLPPPGRP